MRRASRASWRHLGVAVAFMAAAGTPASAQPPAARVRGVAITANGERVVGAQVRVIGRAGVAPVIGTVSDENGAFALAVPGESEFTLVLRRIGFRPETLAVRPTPPSAPPLVVAMTRALQMVSPMVVLAERGGPNAELAAMRERQRTGGTGYFLYREEFMKHAPSRFSDILRRIPGIQMSRSNRSWNEVRLRGNRCAPLYWLDGQPLLGIPFDPDLLPPQDVEAVEVYASSALAPPRFQGPVRAQGCGTIVIWTRRGARPVRSPRIDADSIARLLDANRVFIASEVDTPAKLTSMPMIAYPDSLRSAGASGSAVIEFIVRADGTLDRESVGVVSATHPLFAAALRLAVLDATFEPAVKGHRPVAQVYQLPAQFSAAAKP